MRLRIDSLDFLTPRVPTTTDGLKLRGVTYVGLKFDLDLSGSKACFRAWPTPTAVPHVGSATVMARSAGLKTSALGSGSFVPLSADTPTCYAIGTSVRMVGAH